MAGSYNQRITEFESGIIKLEGQSQEQDKRFQKLVKFCQRMRSELPAQLDQLKSEISKLQHETKTLSERHQNFQSVIRRVRELHVKTQAEINKQHKNKKKLERLKYNEGRKRKRPSYNGGTTIPISWLLHWFSQRWDYHSNQLVASLVLIQTSCSS